MGNNNRQCLSRRDFLLASSSVALLAACQQSSVINSSRAGMNTQSFKTNTPFAMPDIIVPDFAHTPEFDIRAFGAIAGDKHANNRAIASAIDAAHQAGGGRVIIPQGEWVCGKIHLKSFVNLHVRKGAQLTFSGDPKDYLPAVKTSWEGMECYNYSPLIYAYGCEHIALSGEGKLFANLDTWKIWYKRPPEHMQALANLYHMAAKGEPVEVRKMDYEGANLRPHFVHFNRCKHVLVEDIDIENSPFWVLHPYMSEHVVIRGVSVKAYGHNNDGVDPEMTQNLLIEHCEFDQGDDAIAIKAGRNQDAWRLNMPCKNVVIRHCRIKRAHQLIAIGSELSGGIENVFVDDCHFEGGAAFEYEGTGNLMLIKTNERRGGYVRNVVVQNITAPAINGGALTIATDVLYQWKDLVPTYERKLTAISGIHLQNVRVGKAGYVCKIEGQAEMPVSNVTLSNVVAENTREEAVQNVNVGGFEWYNA